jgi:alpha-glucosidase
MFSKVYTVGLGLSGIPFYGHDIGGFFGDHPDEKQFIRWCQSAVFQPRFVIHSWNEDGCPTELWTYRESIGVLKELVELHYEFMPYIYNVAIEASRRGKPMERPLALMFPRDFNIDPDSVHYMFGEDILVLSAVEENEDSVNCYLPEGCEWRENSTRKVYAGGQTVNFDFPYRGMRYLQRIGSIVTTAPGCRKLSSGFFPKLKMDIIPEKGEITKRTYIEDDGEKTLLEGSYKCYSLEIDYRIDRGCFSINRTDSSTINETSGQLELLLHESYFFEESGDSSLKLNSIPDQKEWYFQLRS